MILMTPIEDTSVVNISFWHHYLTRQGPRLLFDRLWRGDEMRSTCGDVRWLLTVPSDQLLAEVGYPAEVDTPPAASSADAAAAARLAHRSHPNLLQQHSPLILGSSAHKIFTDLLFLCVFSVSLQLAPISIAET